MLLFSKLYYEAVGVGCLSYFDFQSLQVWVLDICASWYFVLAFNSYFVVSLFFGGIHERLLILLDSSPEIFSLALNFQRIFAMNQQPWWLLFLLHPLFSFSYSSTFLLTEACHGLWGFKLLCPTVRSIAVVRLATEIPGLKSNAWKAQFLDGSWHAQL
ncbi:hypothetical protein EV426DRAFT_103969 [Tirmania nivea]|nr:hypothetical protein EV426DRAFT_103969 [Tirmania nivea]